MNRSFLLTTLVLLLILINGVTIYFLFKKDSSPERPANPAVLFKKLHLDHQQEQQFEEMRKTHFQKRDSLRTEDIRMRRVMANMITRGVRDSSAIDSITSLLANNRKQFEINFYDHFQQMYFLLRPDQQQQFGEVMELIFKRQGPPPPNSTPKPPHP